MDPRRRPGAADGGAQAAAGDAPAPAAGPAAPEAGQRDAAGADHMDDAGLVGALEDLVRERRPADDVQEPEPLRRRVGRAPG